jgi:hypothetical protein
MKYRLALLVLAAACGNRPLAGPPPTFTMDGPHWTLEKEEYSFTYTGAAVIHVSDSIGAYLVAFQEIRIKLLDPAKPADTLNYAIVITGGRGDFTTSDYTSRCVQYSTSKCIREAQTPEFTVRMIGWQRFEPINH